MSLNLAMKDLGDYRVNKHHHITEIIGHLRIIEVETGVSSIT